MNRPHDEPLSPEERALAERLSRLGPHDGPSPALDAKILAAAHAAVAASRPPRRRWLALSALPGSVITGVGMAAALVLVVGVVWQLRPSDPAPKPAREEGANMGYVSAEIVRRPQAQVAPPPPPPAEPARELRPALARRAAPPAEAAPASAPPSAVDDTHYMDEAVAHAPAPAAMAADASAVVAAPAPAAPPPPSAFSQAAEPERFSTASIEAERREAAAVRYQSQAKARQRNEVASAQAPVELLDEVEMTGAPIQEAPSPGTVAADAAPIASVPVSEDARLPPSQWLRRIRDRRDAGDLDGARASLARFRQDHPGERVPRDLRKLATPTR